MQKDPIAGNALAMGSFVFCPQAKRLVGKGTERITQPILGVLD
jgi:hypothetical protein